MRHNGFVEWTHNGGLRGRHSSMLSAPLRPIPDAHEIEALMTEYVRSSEALVEVHRKLGALLPTGEAARFAATHIGEGEIRIADREFSGFIVVAQNGVATGWRMPESFSLQRSAPPPAER
jgi:hypothetical protein